jgi:hypothetical protein
LRLLHTASVLMKTDINAKEIGSSSGASANSQHF